jgi:hypothetical protein
MLAPARCGLPVAEYSPNLIKKAVVGAGHADKSQIAFMVKRLMPASGDVKADAADALAVAITHAQLRKRALLETAARRGMIGSLRGVLAEVEEGHCLIDCAGRRLCGGLWIARRCTAAGARRRSDPACAIAVERG